MTLVIKSGDQRTAQQVRALVGEPRVASPTPEEARIADLLVALDEARNHAADLEHALLGLRADQESALASARTEAEAIGRAAAEDQSAALAAAVARALNSAVEEFRTRLDRLEAAASSIASIALGRIVGDETGRAALVTAAIRRAVAEVFGDDAVSIKVSSLDFPDQTALLGLDLPIGCEIRTSSALGSGDCLVQLKLGRVDVGLDGQLARLRAELGEAGE